MLKGFNKKTLQIWLKKLIFNFHESNVDYTNELYRVVIKESDKQELRGAFFIYMQTTDG